MAAPAADRTAVLGDRYRLGDPIGRGGMAVVHRARDLLLDRDVAVKLFRDDVAVAGDRRRIETEMRILAQVNHPNLVTLHDASPGHDGEPPYLVMELVEGEDLGHLLPRLTPPQLAALGAQVAQALAAVHERGIVHRDVKPANVLVRTEARGALHAKLADLGIARLVDGTRITAAGTLVGTAAYLSPEQVLGEGPAPASDVYALGLMMIEGLTGSAPFPGTRGESLAARTARAPRIPEGLTPADSSLLAAMTARDPADRPTAAEAAIGLAGWTSTDVAREPSSTMASGPSPEPTAVLGTAPGTTAGGTAPGDTAALDAASDSAPTETVLQRRRRPIAIGAAAVAVLAVVIAALVAFRPGADAPAAPRPSVSYPAVDGDLGADLRRLQESVVPG